MRPKQVEKEAEERDSVENEPAATKIAEMGSRPKKQYRKRDPLADYNTPPVAAENQADGPSNKPKIRRDPLADYNKPPVAAENQADGPSNKPKKRRDPLADYNKPTVTKSSAAENQADGPSNKPKKRRDPLADYNKPPMPKAPDTEIKRTRPNPLAKPKPKPTTAREKNHQPASSNGPACSKKTTTTTTTTTVGEKGRVVKANAAGSKSNRTETLNNTPAASRQSAEPNRQSPSRGGETTFLCYFCSKTKDVKDRHPGRLNTCTQCHASYMAQVAGR